MIRSRSIPRAVGKWGTVASVIVVLACTRVMLAPGTQYSGAWNTELPPGVSSNADSFRTHLINVVPGVKYNRLRAGTCSGCKVKVSIQSIANTFALGPGLPPTTGLAVAHIQNLDPRNTEGYYGFRPSTEADYYFWVDKRPDADSARITVLEVPRVGPVRAGRQKNLQYCHKYPRGKDSLPAAADFVEYKAPCDVGPIAASSKISEASLFSAAPFGRVFAGVATVLLAFETLISQGGWIDCNSGCCT